jgi:iron complex transport system substrate-binding protein
LKPRSNFETELQNAPESDPLRRVSILYRRRGIKICILIRGRGNVNRTKPKSLIRVVSLAPNVTSILLALGAGRELVGVSRWCKDVANVGRRQTVGDCWKLDVDEVMKLNPTLVIGSVPFAPETVAKLLVQPVAFLAINSRSLADIESDIRILGRVVNRSTAAERLIRQMRGGFDHVRRSTGNSRDANRPRVYCEAWPNPRISSPPWVADLVTIAGGTLVVPTGQRVTDEQVAEANPDIIVLAWAATGTKARTATALRNPAWKNVAAVKNKRVVVIRDELLNTPGPPLVRGAQELLRVFRQFRPEDMIALAKNRQSA